MLIDLPAGIPAYWLDRFAPAESDDGPYGDHCNWDTKDGRFRVTASRLHYGDEPVRWYALERRENGSARFLGNERARQYGHQVAGPAFEAVISAMGALRTRTRKRKRAESGALRVSFRVRSVALV